MLKHRVIPCLLLRHGGLVKTLKFSNPRYVGDPINAVRIFNDKEVDELIVLDIAASKDRGEPDYALIEQFAGECFMPLCYGGGIRTVEQAGQLFSLGVEKVCLQSATLEDPLLYTRIAERFGSQSVVASIDVKKNWMGKRCLYDSKNSKMLPVTWMDALQRAVVAGVGEVVLNSVDLDGTMQGMDIELIRQASSSVSVPIIAVGGIGSLENIKEGIDAGASGVAAGAFFVFYGPHRAVLITYPRYHVLEELLRYSEC